MPVLSKQIIVIECPSNLGLKASAPGRIPGVNRLPGRLRSQGLYEGLRPTEIHALVPPVYQGNLDAETGVRNAADIAAFAEVQAALLVQLVRPENFVLAIGGDCSILIGHGLALKTMGRYGLFFLDGHTDYSWPGLSATGGAAGMDFAIVTGRGPEKLTNINNRSPYFFARDCWNVGNRDYEPEYVAAIKNSGIPYWSLRRLRKQSIGHCVAEFLRHVGSASLDGFWIHVDADVLNNEIMPAVDSPAPDGIGYHEWQEILQPLIAHPKVVGMELTIIDPDLDPEGHFTKPFVNEMIRLFRPFTSAQPPLPGG